MNYQQIMKQAQEMQKKMLKMQNELAQKEFEATSGGGMVTAKVSGAMRVLSLTIDKAVVDPNDVGMLQDLIVAAVNEALRKISEESEGGGELAEMAKKMGLKMPGF